MRGGGIVRPRTIFVEAKKVYCGFSATIYKGSIGGGVGPAQQAEGLKMSKIKYFAEHEGTVYTRTSARTYTHIVLGRALLTTIIDYTRKSIKHNEAQRADYQKWIDKGVVDPRYAHCCSLDDYKRYAASCVKLAADYEERIAALEARIAAGERFDAWHLTGWCGRHDLAVKQCKSDDNVIVAVQTR